MQQESPLEKVGKAPEGSIHKIPETYSATDRFLFNATESPEVIVAFKSSHDKKTSCKAIAETLRIMLKKEKLGVLEKWRLNSMAELVFERLSSN